MPERVAPHDEYLTVVGIAEDDDTNDAPPDYTPHVPEGHRASLGGSTGDLFTPPPSTGETQLISPVHHTNAAFQPDDDDDDIDSSDYASHEAGNAPLGRPWWAKACWWSFMAILVMIIVVAAVVVTTGASTTHLSFVRLTSQVVRMHSLASTAHTHPMRASLWAM